MGYTVTNQGKGIYLNLGEKTAQILQNVELIISTRKGTVPQYREFGMPMSFLDRPIHVASPLAYGEVVEALARFEPRATVVGVQCDYVGASLGELGITVEVDIKNE